MSPVLQRLKERKLVQRALADLARAFFVYTGLDAARETWGLPKTIIRGIQDEEEVLLLQEVPGWGVHPVDEARADFRRLVAR